MAGRQLDIHARDVAGTCNSDTGRVLHSPIIDVLGPVAPISVNFNHQLAYFAD